MSLQMQSDVDAEINAQLASNDTGAITAAALRNVLHDMNATIFQIASSQGLPIRSSDTAPRAMVRRTMQPRSTAHLPPTPTSSPRLRAMLFRPRRGHSVRRDARDLPRRGPVLQRYRHAFDLAGGAFVTKTYGDQHDGWLWARSTTEHARAPRTRWDCWAAPEASILPS